MSSQSHFERTEGWNVAAKYKYFYANHILFVPFLFYRTFRQSIDSLFIFIHLGFQIGIGAWGRNICHGQKWKIIREFFFENLSITAFLSEHGKDVFKACKIEKLAFVVLFFLDTQEEVLKCWFQINKRCVKIWRDGFYFAV